jgi:hypothetical protein
MLEDAIALLYRCTIVRRETLTCSIEVSARAVTRIRSGLDHSPQARRRSAKTNPPSDFQRPIRSWPG